MKIAIASGKGGTGKTTLAVNLAGYLQESGEASVLLADLDVEEPNTGIFLHGEILNRAVQYRKIPTWVEDRCTLCGECSGMCNFNALAFLGVSVLVYPELCHGCYMCSDLCPENALPMRDDRIGEILEQRVTLPGTNESVILVESRLDVGREMPTPMITKALEYIEHRHKNAGWIIMDAPPGTSCSMFEAVSHADFVLLVTEPTKFGLSDLRLAVDAMREIGVDFAVVINKFIPGQNLIEDYCSDENIPVVGRIPHLLTAVQLYADGKLLYREIPEVNETMRGIRDLLYQKFAETWNV